MWQDKKGKTDFSALQQFGIQTHDESVEGILMRLAALLGSGCGEIFSI